MKTKQRRCFSFSQQINNVWCGFNVKRSNDTKANLKKREKKAQITIKRFDIKQGGKKLYREAHILVVRHDVKTSIKIAIKTRDQANKSTYKSCLVTLTHLAKQFNTGLEPLGHISG